MPRAKSRKRSRRHNGGNSLPQIQRPNRKNFNEPGNEQNTYNENLPTETHIFLAIEISEPMNTVDIVTTDGAGVISRWEAVCQCIHDIVADQLERHDACSENKGSKSIISVLIFNQICHTLIDCMPLQGDGQEIRRKLTSMKLRHPNSGSDYRLFFEKAANLLAANVNSSSNNTKQLQRKVVFVMVGGGDFIHSGEDKTSSNGGGKRSKNKRQRGKRPQQRQHQKQQQEQKNQTGPSIHKSLQQMREVSHNFKLHFISLNTSVYKPIKWMNKHIRCVRGTFYSPLKFLDENSHIQWRRKMGMNSGLRDFDEKDGTLSLKSSFNSALSACRGPNARADDQKSTDSQAQPFEDSDDDEPIVSKTKKPRTRIMESSEEEDSDAEASDGISEEAALTEKIVTPYKFFDSSDDDSDDDSVVYELPKKTTYNCRRDEAIPAPQCSNPNKFFDSGDESEDDSEDE